MNLERLQIWFTTLRNYMISIDVSQTIEFNNKLVALIELKQLSDCLFRIICKSI